MPAKAAAKRGSKLDAGPTKSSSVKSSNAAKKAKSEASSAPAAAATPSASSLSKRKLDSETSSAESNNSNNTKKAAAGGSEKVSKVRPATKKEPFVTSKVDADESINSGASASLVRAEAHATALFKTLQAEGGRAPTDTEVTEMMLSLGTTWPTQQRPNVMDKPAPGMCLGMVNAFTNGLRVSLASVKCPNLTKVVTRFVSTTLPEPDFKFSSVQINYNYAAKRHVDGNNQGPSYIRSFGQHSGGDLWTADQGVISCRGKWMKFNGKAEHETCPFEGTRVSFIVFTHNACEELDEAVVHHMEELGFTAGSAARKRDPGNVVESDFDAFFAAHRAAHPPPQGVGRIGAECAGYACGRGAAWVSWDCGSPTTPAKKKAAHAPLDETSATALLEAEGSLAGLSKTDTKTLVKTRCLGLSGASKCSVLTSTDSVQVATFEKNRVGLHVVELSVSKATGYLNLVALRRFDLYNKAQASNDFCDYVNSLAPGAVVVVTISDTAIAKKRPMEPIVYEAFKQLGLGDNHEVIGYRNPMVFLGAKGLAQGSATLLLDKRAQSKTVLRLDATIQSVAATNTSTTKSNSSAATKTTTAAAAASAKKKASAAAAAAAETGSSSSSSNSSCPVVIQDVKNSTISATEQCPDRAKEGVVFKNCNAVTKR